MKIEDNGNIITFDEAVTIENGEDGLAKATLCEVNYIEEKSVKTGKNPYFIDIKIS